MPQSLGALGGKPNNAYYFIGFLGKKTAHLLIHNQLREQFLAEKNCRQLEHEACRKYNNISRML